MSRRSLSSSYELIKCCLEKELKDREPRLELLSEPVQLLIMESKRDVAAFAVMNGSSRQSFGVAYEQFKRLYAERNKDWAKRYLSFVLCRTDDSSGEDSFYSELENDVYFCKKYVIFTENLQQEIQRLPFIPLKSDSVTALNRPLPAQSLLQECNVDKRLAFHLVKAKERSAERISVGYLEKEYGDNPLQKPKRLFHTSQDVEQTYQEPTRLKSLTVKNFRAYKYQEFDLDGDIIILYGPNGLGKTSFFDALDFACTGGIARLSGKIEKIASHLDSRPDNSNVAFQIENGSQTQSFTRTVDDRNYVRFDNDRIGRKDLLFNLTGLVWKDTAARVENLEKLFRATHLFGQDYQELLTDYHKDSGLSEEIVARMLAFQDYVAAGKKTQQVVDTLNRELRELSYRCAVIKSKLAETKKQRDELAKTVKDVTTPEAIKKRGQEIADRIKQTLDIDLPIISRIDRDELRSWRATIAGEIELIQRQLETGTSLEQRFEQVAKNKVDLAKKKEELQQCSEKIKTNSNQIVDIHKKHETLLKTIHELTAKEDKLTEKLTLLTWQIKNVKKYNLQLAQRTSLLQQFEGLSLPVDADPVNLQEDEAELLWLKENLSQWTNSNERITTERTGLNTLQEEHKEKVKQLVNYTALHKKNREELLKLENEIAVIREVESNLFHILDNVESLVAGAVCPVCGTNHDTKENLLQRIQEQKRKRPPQREGVIKAHQKKEKEVNDLEQNIGLMERATEAIQEQEKSAFDNLFRLETGTHDFEKRAKRLGLEIDGTLAERIKKKLRKIDIQLEYAAVCRDMEDVTREAKRKNLLLTIDVKELEKTLYETEHKLSELQHNIRSQKEQETTIERELSLVNDHLKFIKRNLSKVNADIDDLVRSISEYEAKLAKLDLKASIDIEMIKSKKDKLQTQATKVSDIKDEIIGFEIAMDSAQSSARLAELASEIGKTSSKLEEQESEIEEINRALDYFREIDSILATQKNTSVSEYTKNFGPLASIIQRRLRPVYGFGPVDLKSKAGKIYVQVSRKCETLRPIDYFSDSQNQILMLSLFLAAGMTQTWSSFAPILMDDPITHFDDLNAYAFVELVHGLIDDAKGYRQFVISTCDESLWELFRQRFSSLNGKAIMYKFVAIGDEGPVVNRIS